MKKSSPVIIAIFAMLSVAASAHAAERLALSAIVRDAKERNPEIAAARERWQAMRARVTAEKTLESPELIAEFEGIPEGSSDPGAAEGKMYGIRQMIPFPGKLGAKGKVAEHEAKTMEWEYRNTELVVVSRVKSAYAMYYYLDKAVETFRQVSELMENLGKSAQSMYAVGKTSQNDVLRAQIESEKMANMAATMELEQSAVRTELNSLTGREPDALLPRPGDVHPVSLKKTWNDIRAIVASGNPEIGRGRAGVEKSRWAKRSAKLEYLPDFDVSYKKRFMMDGAAGSDIMVGATVPLWFWKQKAMVEESSRELSAAEAEARNAELMAVAEAKEAYTKLEATRLLIELYNTSTLPKSEHSLKVAQSTYAAGKASFIELLDTVRSFLEYRLEHFTHDADYLRNLAALERVAGTELTEGEPTR